MIKMGRGDEGVLARGSCLYGMPCNNNKRLNIIMIESLL